MHIIGVIKLLECAGIAIAYAILEIDTHFKSKKSKHVNDSPE